MLETTPLLPTTSDTRHEHQADELRTSAPIELLFDLTLVIGVSVISGQFADSLIRGDSIQHALFDFLFATMFIWLSWLPFVWFCSGCYSDDALFRVGTLAQMAGVLVMVNGINKFFTSMDVREVILGFVMARMAYIVFFRLRVAFDDPVRRAPNLKHAGFTFLLQLHWISLLCLPSEWTWPAGIALGFLELLVPALVELSNTQETPFHPFHIAERYALLTIIIFGEAILAISIATQFALHGDAFNLASIEVAMGGLGILFVLWWLYFLVPFGELLQKSPQKSFVWGYAHFFIHVPLVLVASSLAMCADISGGTLATVRALASPVAQPVLEFEATLICAIAICSYLLVLHFLKFFLAGFKERDFLAVVGTCASVLLVALFSPVVMREGETLVCFLLVLVGLLVFKGGNSEL
ncbi:hypothetical protein HDU98_012357 [Podochytrium sp. JEL0797]|nr:hypothetical protein HDU98_012357 [Podochytrium sp. JEL0797]